MKTIELSRAKHLKGKIIPPPDKSISHRAIIFSSIAKGKSVIKKLIRAEDPLSTLNAFRSLGVKIEEVSPPTHPSPSRGEGKGGGENSELIIHGKGLYGLKEPNNVIDCGNSGTTIRLLSGVLSGNPFFSVLTGDQSLRNRPMDRIIIPLRQFGANITGRSNDRYPPLSIKGCQLKATNYNMPIASAQVKSSLLLASLYADGETTIREPAKSRDHSERTLQSLGANINIDGLSIKIKGGTELKASEFYIPGDFSSAAFFIVAALLIPDSDIKLKSVGINPTRTGLINVLKRMGANIEISNLHEVSGEPVADIHCMGRQELKAVDITKEEIPSLIDEFPILCIASAHASGRTTIRGAEELRVKESDRIKAMAVELRKMGTEIEEFDDGLSIKGGTGLKGAVIESYGDHRIAMSMAIAALIADGTTTINGVSSVNISFPGFFEMLRRLTS